VAFPKPDRDASFAAESKELFFRGGLFNRAAFYYKTKSLPCQLGILQIKSTIE
jgi:hypothetical protein